MPIAIGETPIWWRGSHANTIKKTFVNISQRNIKDNTVVQYMDDNGQKDRLTIF